MKHICFENSIPLETCNYIKDFFDSHPELHVHKPNNPKVIKINSPWSHLHEVLDPILSKYFHTNKGQGGNMIVFNSNNIHTTGTLVGPWKIGVLLQFEGSLDELAV